MYQGSVEQGPMFFDDLVDDVEAIADPDAELFELLGVERGGMREMFGMRAWLRGVQALSKGHLVNRKIGDPWTLPTVFAVEAHTIVWVHRGEHAGDHPDVRALPALIGAAP